MKRMQVIGSALGIMLMLSGCPAVGIGTAVPNLRVGATYSFIGPRYNDSGEVVSAGPGAWVQLNGNRWINLDQTWSVECRTGCNN